MSFRPISEIVGSARTWSPARDAPGADFTYLDIASIDRDEKRIVAPTPIPCAEAPSRARQLVETGDVLVSTVRPGLNAVALVPAELDGATASTGFTVLRPRVELLDSRYLFFWVRSPAFVSTMERLATGASYPAVSDALVKSSRLPLPSLPEQRRIAAILDEADGLRRKRREAHVLLDDLLRATFLDMFGDPLTNPREWELVRLDAATAIASGVTKGRNFDGRATVMVPYMRVANVQDGHIRLDDVKEVEVLPDDVERYRLEVGDVLLTEGGDPDKLGRGAVWYGAVDPCIHQNHIFRVRCDRRKVLPEYTSRILGSELGKRYFARAAKQTTGIASINMTQLRGAPLLLAPLALQREWDQFVEEHSRLRARVDERGSEIDRLFSSLLHRAFTGAL